MSIQENESDKGDNKESSVAADDKTHGIPDDNESDKEDDIKQEDIKSKVSDSCSVKLNEVV